MGRDLVFIFGSVIVLTVGCGSPTPAPSSPAPVPSAPQAVAPAPAPAPARSASASTDGLEDGELPSQEGSNAGLPLTWLPSVRGVYDILATEVTVAQFRTCVNADRCEAATFRASCNYGEAVRANHPMNCVDWHGASAFCEWAGGRLCTEPEWLEACAGSNGRAYPYGDVYALDACNHQSTTAQVSGRSMGTVEAGSLSTCSGGLEGLYDMAGNVAEWVDACKGTYCKFRGAGWRSNDPIARFAGCQGVCSGNQKEFSSGTIGFRCCRDRP